MTGGNIADSCALYDVTVKGRCHLNVVQYQNLYSPIIAMYSFGIKLYNPQGNQIGGMDKTRADQIKHIHMLSQLRFTAGVYPIGEEVQFTYDTAL